MLFMSMVYLVGDAHIFKGVSWLLSLILGRAVFVTYTLLIAVSRKFTFLVFKKLDIFA